MYRLARLAFHITVSWLMCAAVIGPLHAQSNEPNRWDARLDELHDQSLDAPRRTRQSLREFKASKDPSITPENRARAELLIGNTFAHEGDYVRADEQYELAQRRYSLSGDLEMVGRIAANRGSMARRMGNYRQALELYNRAVEIATQFENLEALSVVHNNIGVIFGQLALYEQSARNYELSARFSIENAVQNENADPGGESLPLANLAHAQMKLGNFSDARRSIDQARSALKQNSPKAFEKHVDQAEATYYLEVGKPERALPLLNRLLPYYETRERTEETTETYCLRVRALAERTGATPLNHLEEARECLARARETLDEEGQVEALILFGDIAASSGRNTEALKAVQEAFELQKTFSEKRAIAGVDLAISELEGDLTEASVRLAEQDAALALAQAERNGNLFISVAFAAAFLLLALIGATYLIRARGKANADLVKLNAKSEAQANELAGLVSQRETLLEELNHRVKNNLQIVAALLGLETERVVEGSGEAQTIRDIQARVVSLASIHEAIHSDKATNSVSLDDYLSRLTEKVDELYGGCCEYERDAASDAVIDMKIAGCVGLIAVEFIANAYEHAYDDDERLRKVTVRRYQEGQHQVLTVSDQGKGLSPEFDLKTIETLGLSLVRRLAEQIDAELWAVDAPQGGAVFGLKLPLQLDQ